MQLKFVKRLDIPGCDFKMTVYASEDGEDQVGIGCDLLGFPDAVVTVTEIKEETVEMSIDVPSYEGFHRE